MSNRPSRTTCRKWISEDRFYDPNTLPGEVWKLFTSYNGCNFRNIYYISNKGRVRNNNDWIIRGSISEDGYHTVILDNINILMHRAILYMFVGDPPKDMKHPTGQHINHDKLDNRVENLCWMSAFDNNQEGHGTRCKLVDKYGEHIFPSLKVASDYIGRHEDYIAEGISCGYKITNTAGECIDVYTEINNEWVQYVRAMPNNRRWCQLVQGDNVYEFESLQQCSIFLNQPSFYLSTILGNEWPVDVLPDNTTFSLYDPTTNRYLEYTPKTNKKRRASVQCEIHNSDGTKIVFSSIRKAARYIGRDSENVRINLRDHKPIRDKNNQLIDLRISDM